jgi:DNA-directed RNA polymerase specialized sigma subunit
MDDGALWVAYETAGDEATRSALAQRIVETHLPFLRYYAAQTAFPYWPDHVREEYVAELVIVAMQRVPTYNRLRLGESGKVAKFVTYLKPYLQGVRWDISAREAPLRVGRENRRMRADAQRFIREREQIGGDVSWEEIAEAVSVAHGKPVSVDRIRRIVEQPTVVSGDAHVDEDGHTLWEVETPAGRSPEDVVVEGASLDELTREVREAIAEIASTPLERRIVFSRLMATSSDRVSHREIAERCHVSVAQVVRVERDLAERLREALSAQFPPL